MKNSLIVRCCFAVLVAVCLPPGVLYASQTIQYPWLRFMTNSTLVSPSLGFQPISLAIGLPLRNERQLDQLLGELTDPASTNYHHWLKPGEFAQKFGPSQADYDNLINFMQAQGMTISACHSNRLLLDVTGPASTVEQVFHVHLRTYQHPTENRLFYAPDRAPSIDSDVPIAIVEGLDNFTLPKPQVAKVIPLSQVRKAQTGSGPIGLFMGNDFRSAYVPGATLTGKGQTVGLLEFDSGWWPSDVLNYEAQAGLPNVPVEPVLVDGFGGMPSAYGDIEVTADIDMVISMAPGLSKVLVYEGSYVDDILNRMATDDAARQISASWLYTMDTLTDSIFKEFIAQGQTFFNVAGDQNAYSGLIPTPADDTNVTIVGGTTLTTSGNGGSWVSETVWNWGNEYGPEYAEAGGSGGYSTIVPIPKWQKGINMTANQGSTTMRNLPDVAMVADNLYVIIANGYGASSGGTSFAGPLWAGFTALANELAEDHGQPPVGFLNPIIYSIGKGQDRTSYAAAFHDITTGNNESPGSPNRFSAVPGYDLCTGWGTPTGTNLLAALAGPLLPNAPSQGPATVPAPSASVTVPGVSLDTLYSFPAGELSGAWPFAPLVQGRDGALYGTTVQGGTNGAEYGGYNYGAGTIFKITTHGSFTSLYSFTFSGDDGGMPRAGLALGKDGNFYGSSEQGGPLDLGGLFEMSPAGEVTPLYDFAGAEDGSYPAAGLIQGNDGNFYGDALFGGAYAYGYPLGSASGYGTIFSLATNGSVNPLAEFNLTDGAWPSGTLVQGADGNFYGTTESGGNGGATLPIVKLPNGGEQTGVGTSGTIFKMTPSGVITTLYAFTGGSDGSGPMAGLTQGADGNFYGVTIDGGSGGVGTLFKITPAGQFTLLHSFTGVSDGANPSGGLVQSTDGNLYGTTLLGGAYGNGTVFRIGLNGQLATLLSFSGLNGASPSAALMQASDGNLYGTTTTGGSANNGTVFRLEIGGPLQITSQPQNQTVDAGASALFTVATFGSLPDTWQWQKDGKNLVDNGNVSGAATATLKIMNAAATDAGDYSVIIHNASGSVTSDKATLVVVAMPPQITGPPVGQSLLTGQTATFSVTATGDGPLSYQWQKGGMALHDGGQISGSTGPVLTISNLTVQNSGAYSVLVRNAVGSAQSRSAILTVDQATAPFVDLAAGYLFTDQYDGAFPWAGLILGTDGNLYGTTAGGGAYAYGSIFAFTPATATVTPMYSFTGGFDGGMPYSSLIQGSDGNFYGTASTGGYYGYGDVFQMPFGGGTVNTIYSFTGYNDGFLPMTGLVQGADGNFYGTTSAGGTSYAGAGTIFMCTTSGVLTALYDFGTVSNSDGDPLDGGAPNGLIQASDGNFYGTASYGGTHGYASPGAPMIEGNGTVFKITPAGALTILHSFAGGNEGMTPSAGLLEDGAGTFYGTTYYGGASGAGTIFEITAKGSLTTLYSFKGSPDGANPAAALIKGPNGSLLGTTANGGGGGYGTVFAMDTTGNVQTLASFTGPDGAYPAGTLLWIPDANPAAPGVLYGTTVFGGINFNGTSYSGQGTIFILGPNGLVPVTGP